MEVKICGITNLPDALMSVEAGANVLGFNFYKGSPRYIAPDAARSIIAELPRGVQTVGVFVNEPSPSIIERIAGHTRLGAVQLHGDESPAYCRSLRHLTTIKALRIGAGFKLEHANDYGVNYVLLDAFVAGARGGTGATCDWAIARAVRERVPRLILAGGLSAENVSAAIEAVRPFAVDACSRVESSPGVKDEAKVREFMQSVLTTKDTRDTKD